MWLFNQSSGHTAFREDALNVSKMNVGLGGAQPRMRDTLWNGKLWKMVLNDGRPKLVLEERGIDTSRMRAGDV